MLLYFLLDMSSEKFALFFERSNSLGTRLDLIDILVAKLNSGFRLRTKVDELKEKTGYNIERELLVRTIAFLVSKEKNIDKGYILSTLTYEHFNKYWDIVCDLYIDTLDFLFKNNFIITQDWIPHSNMLIPLMIFLNNLPNRLFNQMNEVQLEFIRYWYWGSIFAQRYTGGNTNELIIRYSKVVTILAKGDKIHNKNYFREFKIVIEQAEDLYSFTKKGSLIYKGILNFINYISEKDFSYTDCVVNRTLIPKIINIKIGKKAPDKYLNQLYDKNNKLKESLKKHMIHIEILAGVYNEFFSVFIEDRVENIFEYIKVHAINKKDEIEEKYYKEINKIISNNINILLNSKVKLLQLNLIGRHKKYF